MHHLLGTGLVISTALAVSVLTTGPAQSVPTPGAPPMPAALTPGKVTTPVFPLRSVPAYSLTTAVATRVRPSDGGVDKRYQVPTPAGSQLLWGDWNRDGAFTPIVFTNGHWVVYDAVLGSTPVPGREFDYGMAGDKFVAGDWNGDGRTDIGVVRGNVWLLRKVADAGATWRRISIAAKVSKAIPAIPPSPARRSASAPIR